MRSAATADVDKNVCETVDHVLLVSYCSAAAVAVKEFKEVKFCHQVGSYYYILKFVVNRFLSNYNYIYIYIYTKL